MISSFQNSRTNGYTLNAEIWLTISYFYNVWAYFNCSTGISIIIRQQLKFGEPELWAEPGASSIERTRTLWLQWSGLSYNDGHAQRAASHHHPRRVHRPGEGCLVQRHISGDLIRSGTVVRRTLKMSFYCRCALKFALRTSGEVGTAGFRAKIEAVNAGIHCSETVRWWEPILVTGCCEYM